MKNISIFAIVLILCIVGFSSCEKDDYTGATVTSPTSPTATISELGMPDYMIEQDTTFNYTITLDQPQIVDIVYNVSLTDANTATEGVDFDFDHSVLIKAYETSGSGSIYVYTDCENEGDEVIALTIGAGGSAASPNNSFTPREVSMTLGNTIGRLDAAFVWGADVTINDTMYALCDYVDIDIYVFNEAGEDQGLYGGATGACPEFSFMDGLEDGVYFFRANLWSNTLPASPEPISFPITSYYEQCGGFSDLSFTQQVDFITSDDLDYYDDGTGVFVDVARVTLEGGFFTVENIQ